jgi:excinuclease ABC subunit C
VKALFLLALQEKNLKPSQEKNSFLPLLPENPGVYEFFDSKGKIIYVGKAKNLKKRVSSYFTKKEFENNKTRILVSQIADIKYVVVESEQDALLLENNLIKKYQPKYNVLLKDDKTFPWICIKNERFPRVFYTRNLLKDKSIYFGPYTSLFMAKTIIEQVKNIYKLRTCKYVLSEENIKNNKIKPCLEYHIGNCKAPCVGNQLEHDYNANILEIKDILKGNINNVISFLKTLMNDFSNAYEYEKAQNIKEKIETLEKYKSKSTIVNPSINNIDVYSIYNDENYAYVNYLKVAQGAIIQSHNLEIKKKLDETSEDLLLLAMVEITQKFKSIPTEIIVPFEIESDYINCKISVPKMGDKKKLLELSFRNVKYYRLEHLKIQEKINHKSSNNRLLEKVKEDLYLKNLPNHIECFDNSNLQGTNAVAACVVFKNGKASKKDYRHYNIKTVAQIDDFASMKEIVYRRYKRLIDENENLPQLIVIDGGKGQLSSAVSALKELNIYGNIAVLGLAKKLEEIYFPEDKTPLYLNKKSETLKLLQNIRNEAHRFGITFHRLKRSKKLIISELDGIEGIGEKTKELLITTLKSTKNIKKASKETLIKIVGKKRADIIYNHFQRT